MASDNLRERAFVIIKPDGVQRGLVGEIIQRFERKGLRLVGLKMIHITLEQARRQYACHEGKPFYDSLIKFMTSGPSVAMVLEGRDAIALVRKLMGATDPLKSEPGTIRGDHSVDIKHNLVHGADSLESYQHEMPIYFAPDELFDYELALTGWMYYR
ncbi:MAG: Nucleoside diphosphate kinase [Candidatus Ozemobacter sibiricus]|uniref:Nucleoside diphosphate kinase n=1 Tax=Candidatus Ozemobacter sibiricus TaxID=2268124 RepID=A0A367ZNU1_9BACT|nr:MAG: Nucleoside diphosphate kinase [Candidatus Ozemobacter sibiricus]